MIGFVKWLDFARQTLIIRDEYGREYVAPPSQIRADWKHFHPNRKVFFEVKDGNFAADVRPGRC